MLIFLCFVFFSVSCARDAISIDSVVITFPETEAGFYAPSIDLCDGNAVGNLLTTINE